MNDVEDRVRAALAARAAVTEPPYDAVDEFVERIGHVRKQRHHRLLAVAAAVIVVLAVALPVTLTRAGRSNGAPPVAPASSTPPDIPGHAFFSGMLSTDKTGVFDASSGRQVTNPLTVASRAEAVATWPGHGWLIARRSADGCHSVLTSLVIVPQPGLTSVVTPAPGLIDEMVVSPDGRQMAAVERSCDSLGYVDVLVIDLSTGAQHRWTRPNSTINAVDGLTWSPDSKRLAYTAGLNTGGGLGGGYADLDVAAAGGTFPAVRPGTGQVDIGNSRCDVTRGMWLGRSGRFAVFAQCPGSDALFLARVPFGSSVPRGDVVAALPGESGTLFPDASVTDDGRHVLVTTNDATYRIDDGKVFRLEGTWRSPSW